MDTKERIIKYQNEEIELYRMICDVILCLDPETYVDVAQKIMEVFDEKIENIDNEIKKISI